MIPPLGQGKYAAGWNLDRISLSVLIIALGLRVDDAMIAVAVERVGAWVNGLIRQ